LPKIELSVISAAVEQLTEKALFSQGADKIVIDHIALANAIKIASASKKVL